MDYLAKVQERGRHPLPTHEGDTHDDAEGKRSFLFAMWLEGLTPEKAEARWRALQEQGGPA